MNNFKEIDLKTWPRTKAFEHFKSFASPVFQITCKVGVDPLYAYAKANGESVFLMSLYAIARAVNLTPELRQRIVDGKVLEFEKTDVFTPVMYPNRQFVEIVCEYTPNFKSFKELANPKINAVKEGKVMPAIENFNDVFCATCNPWFHFDSAIFANYTFDQTMPLIAWGKIKDGQIPLTLKASHCFLDGLHVGEFFARLEHFFANPKELF